MNLLQEVFPKMKIRILIAATAALLVYCVKVPLAQAQENVPATRTDTSQASLAGGTTIKAELNSSIDSKKMKTGDVVTAHTLEAVKSADDRMILPRGTKIVGHITQASARSKGDGESAVGISFDKAVLKGGEEVPLIVAIQALAEPPHSPVGSMSPGPTTVGTTRTSPMSGSRDPRPGNTANPPPGGYPDGNDGSATESDPISGTSKGVYGLNGLSLGMAEANGALVAMITSNGKNVHLDGGTRMLLVTRAPAAGH